MVHAIVLVIVLSANIARIQAALPIFNIVRFPNDACNGGTKNGTCYTKQECSSLGGTSSKDCAEGFGVCCVFSLSCGQTSSQNNTYLTKTGFTTLTEQCVYNICPMSTSICRIRFDFTSLVLTDNFIQTATADATATTNGGTVGLSSLIGMCTKDSFQIIGAKSSSPVICGSNMNGQHMILDVDQSDCLTVAPFIFSGDTTTSRSWDMTVTQYLCSDQDVAGPPGCLQYFTGTTGNLRDFKMPSTIVASSSAGALGTTAIGATQTHLKNQDYNICIRRASTSCRICYHAVRKGAASTTDQSSFGISTSTTAGTAQATVNSECHGDYLEIDNVLPSTTCTTLANCRATAATTLYRLCGRYFGTDMGVITGTTLCSTQVPFTIRVVFDDDEPTAAAASMATESEGSQPPSGHVGFALYYKQDCF